MPQFTVTLSGDTKALKNLDRAITHAAKQTCVAVAFEAQDAAIKAIASTFKVRGTWYLPSGRYGLHVRYSKNRDDLSARLETPADWLEEHETGDDRTPDRHDGHLTIPHAARPGGYGSLAKVPSANKARRILPNASLLSNKALVRTSGRPSTSGGKRFTAKPTKFFLNRAGTVIFERLEGHRLRIFYTLTTRAHIRHQSTVVLPTERIVELRFGHIFDEKLRETIEFRKGV